MKINVKVLGTAVAALGAVIAGGVFSKSKKDDENATTDTTATTEATTVTETSTETKTETSADNSAE